MRGQGITVDQLSTFQAGKVEKVCYLKRCERSKALMLYFHRFYKLR